MADLVDVSSLGVRGFTISGAIAGDAAGWSVASAGDVNGDGFDDVIIGAPYNDFGANNSGSAYVVYGRAGGFGNVDLGNLSPTSGFKISSGVSQLVGLSVSAAGDVNGDGFDDVVVGSFLGGYANGSATAYVVFGKAGGGSSIDVSHLASSDGFSIGGIKESPYYRGFALTVADAGDVNGDGFDDLVLGARYANTSEKGIAYVVFGGAQPANIADVANLTTAQGFSISGASPFDHLGGSVSGAGDINGDGYDDIILGAYSGDAGGSSAGQAYVIFGKASGFASIDLASLSANTGFMIQGDATNDLAGISVSGAGDVNGDGFDDLIIGAPGGDDGGSGAGEAYVIFGKASGFGTIDLTNIGSAGFIIKGAAADNSAGGSVSSAGDFNHDGLADLLVLAAGNNEGGPNSGRAYVIFGKLGGFSTIDLGNLATDAGVIIQGTSNTGLGWSTTSAGDINHDGFSDILIGAPFGPSPGGGKVYVISGNPTLSDVRNDFNGDGRSDILLRDDAGQVTEWLGSAKGGFTANSSNLQASVPADWKVVGLADFNGDGRDDILWRHASGVVTDWIANANGGFSANSLKLYESVSNDWQVAGTGDFNGDGRDDVLWRSNTGQVTDWLATATGGFNGTNMSAAVPTDWKVVATGDFNGDGRDDILWRHDGGTLTNWLGTATGGFVANGANASFAVPLNWQVWGVDDFNGDGRDDILWRNTDGTITDWFGTQTGGFVTTGPFTSVPLNWRIAGTGDVNGDGRGDIIWRSDTGILTDWLGNQNGSFTDNAAQAWTTTVANSWHIQDPLL